MRIVLTGGGTGGHIYPAISVGQALRALDPGVELLFVGSSHGPEGRLAAEAGIAFEAVPSSPLSKKLSLSNAVSLARLGAGVFRARGILRRFGPDVVVGTGGYTTAAILLAQRSLGGKVVIHEQNAMPGRTNLWLSRIADRVCVTFDSSAAFFPTGKVVVTGLPIRQEFSALVPKPEARRRLGLDEDRFTILVLGGSQGAKGLNDLVLGAWPLIGDRAQILHQVGARNIDEMRAKVDGLGHYWVEAYVDTLLAMAGADLVIGRSGASTLAEITAVGLPSILVPYPYAIADEQRHNALYLCENKAAIMCEEKSSTPQSLAEIFSGLVSEPDRFAAMAMASAALGRPDAARNVAEVAMALAS